MAKEFDIQKVIDTLSEIMEHCHEQSEESFGKHAVIISISTDGINGSTFAMGKVETLGKLSMLIDSKIEESYNKAKNNDDCNCIVCTIRREMEKRNGGKG